jgi:hypothetical protein
LGNIQVNAGGPGSAVVSEEGGDKLAPSKKKKKKGVMRKLCRPVSLC